jgi:predicted enzyme related to lactoylglutathione lyase
MPNPVVHFEIIGGSSKQLQDFYSSLFDWKIDSNNEYNYGMVDTASGAGIAGGIAADMDGHGSRVTVYAQVPDVQASLNKAEQLGGKVLLPPTPIGQMTIAMFSDPAGNTMGLMHE